MKRFIGLIAVALATVSLAPAQPTVDKEKTFDARPLLLAGCAPDDQPRVAEITPALASKAALAFAPDYAIYSTYLWPRGSLLKVSFMDGNLRLHQLVRDIAKQWEACANIRFDFGYNETSRTFRRWSVTERSDIRISFSGKFGLGGNVCYIGRTALEIPQTQATMNLSEQPGTVYVGRFERVVLHEFGHALGFRHEHQHPGDDCNDEIDLQKAYDYYARTQNPAWEPQRVRYNLLNYDNIDGYTLSATRDNTSIMMYELPPEILKNGTGSKCFIFEARKLSDQDKVGARRAYPFEGDDQAIEERILTVNALIENSRRVGSRSAASPEVVDVFKHNLTVLRRMLVK